MINTNELDRYFLKLNGLNHKIRIKELELEALREKTIGATNYGEKSSSFSNNNSGIEVRLVQIEKKEDNLKKIYNKRDEYVEKYEKDFTLLSKEIYQLVLSGFYLDKLSMKSLSIKIGKSLDHTKKIKREAVRELIQLLKDKKINID